MDKHDALAILDDEKSYEDDLIAKIMNNHIPLIDDLEGVVEADKIALKEKLTIIMNESKMHSKLFDNMRMRVREGKDDF